ncbi:MAG: hypothetical protein D6690_05735 [Nitrospirae bacterium]|nr:MAG: hypothetical protein D6690_05735 [Nitrospirota bacterium]
MVTIMLMGQLETSEGERTLSCEITEPVSVKTLIRKQGKKMRDVFQLLKEQKIMVTVNKRIASEDTQVYDGDIVNLVAHDGMGRSGLTPSMF